MIFQVVTLGLADYDGHFFFLFVHLRNNRVVKSSNWNDCELQALIFNSLLNSFQCVYLTLVNHSDCCRCFRGSGQQKKTLVRSKKLINVDATVSGLLSRLQWCCGRRKIPEVLVLVYSGLTTRPALLSALGECFFNCGCVNECVGVWMNERERERERELKNSEGLSHSSACNPPASTVCLCVLLTWLLTLLTC